MIDGYCDGTSETRILEAFTDNMIGMMDCIVLPPQLYDDLEKLGKLPSNAVKQRRPT